MHLGAGGERSVCSIGPRWPQVPVCFFPSFRLSDDAGDFHGMRKALRDCGERKAEHVVQERRPTPWLTPIIQARPLSRMTSQETTQKKEPSRLDWTGLTNSRVPQFAGRHGNAAWRLRRLPKPVICPFNKGQGCAPICKSAADWAAPSSKLRRWGLAACEFSIPICPPPVFRSLRAR